MQILFIRHAEPDYAPVTSRNYKGHGRDLAPLSERGIEQAYNTALDDRLEGAELILSSPYTRDLQTAAVISRIRNLPLRVEVDLHEWIVDLNFDFDNYQFVREAAKEAELLKGIPNGTGIHQWESYRNLANRAFRVLDRYRDHPKLIVVTHGILIRQFVGDGEIPLGGIIEYELPLNYEWKPS
ncbi:MAG: histidine phosphatase family protein [Clostridiaceae bacterium]|mgnify:CR=1 FL=1